MVNSLLCYQFPSKSVRTDTEWGLLTKQNIADDVDTLRPNCLKKCKSSYFVSILAVKADEEGSESNRLRGLQNTRASREKGCDRLLARALGPCLLLGILSLICTLQQREKKRTVCACIYLHVCVLGTELSMGYWTVCYRTMSNSDGSLLDFCRSWLLSTGVRKCPRRFWMARYDRCKGSNNACCAATYPGSDGLF